MGPYGRLLERFHLSNEALDRLLAAGGVWTSCLPIHWPTSVHIVLRLPPLLTASVEDALLLRASCNMDAQEYIIAGGADKLGVSEYDYEG